MYPNQHRPQPPSPTGRVVGPVPCVPSGYPSHQLPGNGPKQIPPLQFATYPRPGYVQAYPQQVVHHPPLPRLISGHYVNSVSPQKCDVIPGGPQQQQQQQQFWQQVVLSPYPPPQQQQQQHPQHQLQPGETVIYGGGGYMTQQVENRFQHQNISGMNQISQNPMLSMDPSSQNNVSYHHGHSQQVVLQQNQHQQQQFPVQYTFPTTSTMTSHEKQQHSNLNQSQFTQVRFQMPLLSPSGHQQHQQMQQQQQQLQQIVPIQQQPEGSVMFMNSTATSSLTTTTTTTTATTHSSVVGSNNSVFIHQQLMPMIASQEVQKVSVPWSWTRRVTADNVIFVR